MRSDRREKRHKKIPGETYGCGERYEWGMQGREVEREREVEGSEGGA